MFSLIYASTNGWLNNGEAGDLRPHHAHCDVTVMTDEQSYEIKQSTASFACHLTIYLNESRLLMWFNWDCDMDK